MLKKINLYIILMSSYDRRFQVVSVAKAAQKNATGKKQLTKYDKDAVYHGTPERAARKAFTHLCKGKQIKGRCTLNVSVQEIGRGKTPLVYQDGKQKIFSYSLRRQKLENPKVINKDGTNVTFKYQTVARSTSNVCTKNSKLRRCSKK